jgi:hypothetical protein
LRRRKAEQNSASALSQQSMGEAVHVTDGTKVYPETWPLQIRDIPGARKPIRNVVSLHPIRNETLHV